MEPKYTKSPEAQASGNNKNLILLMGILSSSAGAFMSSSLNVALPAINQQFKNNAILQNWVVTSFILSTAIFSIPGGRLADIIGLKKITIYGIIIFLLSTLAAIFSNSIIMLIICRVFQGIGAAVINATLVAMVTINFPAKERGKALGIYISSVYGWLSVGPFLGGLLTTYFGWQSLFVFCLPFSLAILALLLWKVNGEWASAGGEKFDYGGTIIFGLALVALIYGFSQLPQISGIILTFMGILGVFIFLVWENRNQSPIINIRIFRRNRTFIFANMASLINYSSTFAISYLLSLYLQYVKGFSPDYAGLILISQPVIQALISPFTGRLSDKIEPRIIASSGMAMIFLGLMSLVFLNDETSLVQIIITLIVLGIGYGLFVPPNTNAIMSSVEPRYYAVASSVTGTMRTIGQTLSMGVTLVVIAVVIGPVVMTHENHPGFLNGSKVSFIIFAILCLAGIFASLSRGKLRQTAGK